MKEKQEKEVKKRIFIQVSLSEKEKELIQEIAKKEQTNASGLMRIGIFDYLRKLKNPEMFAKKTSLNSLTEEEIEKNARKTIELQKLQIENQNILEEMNTTLTLIKNFSMRPELEAKNTVLNLFKAYPSLNPKEIIDKTDLDKNIVFSIISELQSEKTIEMTSKGRFKIR